jgi:hypothetical protein
MQAATKRVIVLGTLTLALALAAACYSPKLKNFGFACDTNAAKPCPDGYFCRSGFCDDGTGGSPPAGTGGNGSDDMAMASGGGGGGGGGSSDEDMAKSIPDMAKSIPDMAKSIPDMVVVNTCAHDECTAGTALTKSCSACATAVCKTGNDPYCCQTKWDSTCASTDVAKYCTTKTCP